MPVPRTGTEFCICASGEGYFVIIAKFRHYSTCRGRALLDKLSIAEIVHCSISTAPRYYKFSRHFQARIASSLLQSFGIIQFVEVETL